MTKRQKLLAKVMLMGLVFGCAHMSASAQVGPFGPPPPNVFTQPKAAQFPNISCTNSVTAGVTSYDLYRGITTGGPYGKITATPLSSCPTVAVPYRDTTAAFGIQNYYVFVAKSSTGTTSLFSTEAGPAVAVAATTGSPEPPTGVNVVVAFFIKVGKLIYAGLRRVGAIFG